MRERLARLLELVARREQVLDRVVVERLGERLALALLGRERVGEQARAASASRATSSVRRASSMERRTQATPTQARKPAWVTMKRDRLRLPRGGVSAGLDDVGGRGHDDGGAR